MTICECGHSKMMHNGKCNGYAIFGKNRELCACLEFSTDFSKHFCKGDNKFRDICQECKNRSLGLKQLLEKEIK